MIEREVASSLQVQDAKENAGHEGRELESHVETIVSGLWRTY